MIPQTERNWLETEQIGEVTVAKFNRRIILKEHHLEQLGQQLLSLGEEAGHGSILLDFALVDRLSTEMVGRIISLHRSVQRRGGRLMLCQLKPPLFQIFRTFNLHHLMPIYAD